MTNPKDDLKGLINEILVKSDLSIHVKEYLKNININNVIIISFGKGSTSMSDGALEILDNKIEGGVVVIPKGSKRPKGNFEVIESSHPIPDENSIKAADSIMEWIKTSDEKTNFLFLISGGGSSLVEKPLNKISLDDIKVLNKLLLDSGASISEINTVRKHVSQIKGGRLASYIYPKKAYGLYASDVPGDVLDQIASGPTVPDPTTFNDAFNVILNYGLNDKIPKSVLDVLSEGIKGNIRETPKPGDKVFEKIKNEIIANNELILRHVSNLLSNMGYKTIILTSRIEGESREVGYALASITLDCINKGLPISPPVAFILGGETSVTVKGNGIGGRNMELALSWGLKISENTHYKNRTAILAIATDGIDGPTDSAGALLSGEDIDYIKSLGIDIKKELKNNNSYYVLNKANLLIKTGQTGSNLNNVIIITIK
ncbi:putative glycerate kinase [Caldisphaera lagunensis DSM 15908]|uniref:Putative glycerate kinase n=1 Tax=Caldisphaera lagunensis (strain DSM 15908 / JCM 11604 / ANMR 0165 / IC-154) TaxID=1056495 RepID=L0AB77_CALLD|nr:glycerate kinase [Caldisphaera lagunensis]AFZ70305.1 putative glycerate kinase [Caldisphaera lagunensis DSM 15908]